MLGVSDVPIILVTIYNSFSTGFGIKAGEADKLGFKSIAEKFSDDGWGILRLKECWFWLGFSAYGLFLTVAGTSSVFTSGLYLLFSILYPYAVDYFKDTPYGIVISGTAVVSVVAMFLISKWHLFIFFGVAIFLLRYLFSHFDVSLFVASLIVLGVFLGTLLLKNTLSSATKLPLSIIFALDGSIFLLASYHVLTGTLESGKTLRSDLLTWSIRWNKETVIALAACLLLSTCGVCTQMWLRSPRKVAEVHRVEVVKEASVPEEKQAQQA